MAHSLDDDFFLPDFCGTRAIFAVVVLAEIFALMLVVAGGAADPWAQLGLTSLFMLAIALSGAALLCTLRPWLARLSDTLAGGLAYLLLMVLLLVYTLGIYWYARQSGVPLVGEEFPLRSLLLGAMVSALALRYLYVRQQWQRRLRAEAEARIQALQARIRPHFLFNSLNTIAGLTHASPDKAEEAVLDLAELMRAALGDGRALVPLSEELILCRHYIEMERLRLGDRLQVEWQLEPGLPEQTPIPPLSLQPLLENAVYHGIEPRLEGGRVVIAARHLDGCLEISLENPADTAGIEAHGNQMALENIRQRLALHFNGRAALACQAEDGRFRVVMTLPDSGGTS